MMNTNLTKKLQNYTLLAVAGALILNTGCKKDDEEEQIVDNPNVEFIDITDIVADATGKEDGIDEVEFDINKDGVNDFSLYSQENDEDDEYGPGKFTFIYGLTSNSSVAVKGVKLPFEDDLYSFALELETGRDIKGLTFNEDDDSYGYTSIEYVESGTKVSEGIQGKGDKYVGVRFKIGTATHYGWLKVNVDKNALKITVKEVAYNKVAGETLKAGDR